MTTALSFVRNEIVAGGGQLFSTSYHLGCLMLIAFVLMSAGCSKKTASTETSTPSGQSTSPAATASGVSQSDMNTVLSQLTQALRKYGFENRRVPASFSELQATGMLGLVPAAPAGKKYSIDAKAMQVVLADQ